MSFNLSSTCRFIHHWIGYSVAFPFFILCFTGSLAIFSDILQVWMQPQSANAPILTPLGLSKAAEQLLKSQNNAFLRLPTHYDPIMRLSHYDGHIFQTIAIDPSTGNITPLNNVLGGSFFVTLHSTFYMPQFWGPIAIFICASIFILIFISGIFLQFKRFFPDLLLFRPQARPQRKILDLHLLIATLTLPLFSFIILSSFFLSLNHLPIKSPIPPHIIPKIAQQNEAITISDFTYLYQKGQKSWKNLDGSFFMIIQNKLFFYAPDQQHFCLTRNYMTINSTSHYKACSSIKSFMLGLHDFRWAPLNYRLFYGFTGILGCLLSWSAMEFFLRKHIKQLKRQEKSIILHIILPHIHQSIIWGLPIATLLLLISTRIPAPSFLPALLWQKDLFFFSWIGCVLLPQKYPQALFVIISMFFPFLDIMTRPSLMRFQIIFIIIDIIPIFISLLYLLHLFFHIIPFKKQK